MQRLLGTGLVGVVLALSAIGCGGEEPTPTPVTSGDTDVPAPTATTGATAVPAPTATQPPATPTPETGGEEATPTPTDPTATPTEPASTPTPEATLEPTPKPQTSQSEGGEHQVTAGQAGMDWVEQPLEKLRMTIGDPKGTEAGPCEDPAPSSRYRPDKLDVRIQDPKAGGAMPVDNKVEARDTSCEPTKSGKTSTPQK